MPSFSLPAPGRASSLTAGLAALLAIALASGCGGSPSAESAASTTGSGGGADSRASGGGSKGGGPSKLSVTIRYPTSSSTVRGVVTVAGSATSASRVDLQVDSGAIVAVAGTSSWSTELDTSSLPDGSHSLTACATDSAGATKKATITVLVANAPAPDTTAPTVSIGAPSAGAIVGGVLSIGGTASDDVGLANVQILVDAGAPRAATGTASWAASVDTTALANGGHTITAVATDTSGNTRSASVPVTVSNSVASGSPSIAISNPAAKATLQGSVVVRGTAAAPAGIARVEFRVDSGAWAVASGTTSWSASIPSTAWPNGGHAVSARVTDRGGAQATATVPVAFSNTLSGPLAISIQSPRTTAPLAGPITVTGVATGAARIRVKVDSLAYVDVPVLGDWSHTFESVPLANGLHTLMARADDAAGNPATDTISFSVSNADSPPTVTFVDPADGVTVSGRILLRARAYHLAGASQVQFSVDGGPYGYSEYLDTSKLANGPHTVTARSTSPSGVVGTASIVLAVASTDLSAPRIQIASPSPGTAVSGVVTLSGTASDDVGVARVELESGGGTVPASGTTSWSLGLDTRRLANGPHDLILRAVDAAGNTGWSTTTVVVSNPRSVDHYVSPEGVVVDVDSAGGWSAVAVYEMLRASAVDLGLIGPQLHVVVQDGGVNACAGSRVVNEGRCTPGPQTISLNGVSGLMTTSPERSIAHEYGHAWASYWLCQAQQLDWSAYLDLRALTHDPRLDSVYPTWSRDEMIAEDYRLAFGSPSARDPGSGFTNRNLPYEPGLRDFFLHSWSIR